MDLSKAAAALNVTGLERADADAAKGATGYSIGATPPFGHGNLLSIALDERIFDFDLVWAAGGRTDTVFKISAADLLKASGAKVAHLREGSPAAS